jgi:transcriptional regulator with XRE-family HTH domain
MPVDFDRSLMQLDAAKLGLSGAGLAKRARVSQMTVSRFWRGGRITAPTAKKLARALERPLSRYVVGDPVGQVAS